MVSFLYFLAVAEQQRDAPQAGESYNAVNDAADKRGLSPEKIGDQVKLKQRDESPIDCAKDDQKKGYAIQCYQLLFKICR